MGGIAVSITELIPARTLPLHIAPVEYAVAVERYLASASLSDASRRIYRISLTSWSWPLVGQQAPGGRLRRGAVPPVVPLAVLDDVGTRARLAVAMSERGSMTDARTVNRELSALRSAAGWWQDLGWLGSDPTAGLRHAWPAATCLSALTEKQLVALWRSDARLREHAFWHLLHDSAAPAPAVLALDAADLDLERRQVKAAGMQRPVRWSAGTSDLIGWLLAGRSHGPVFLTGRRAPARASGRDVCPLTGRARMSYRRAAEIFTAHTAALDPRGRGWTLHQLRRS
jgi:integrase/recombinase XerD